jgi:hypothetical protein
MTRRSEISSAKMSTKPKIHRQDAKRLVVGDVPTPMPHPTRCVLTTSGPA